MKVLALMRPEMRPTVQRQMASIGAAVTFISRAADLHALTHEAAGFSVAILPASLPEADLWALLGALRLSDPRPEILIYAAQANFQVWSGVLEVGFRDILLEPFSPDELRRAVLDAAAAFEERMTSDSADETC